MSDILLMIHSTGTSPAMWKNLVKGLKLPWRVVTPTHLGYPPNPLLAKGTPFHWSADLQQVMAAIPADAEGVHLVAHSYGGQIALHAALALGERVRSLWLYEPVLFGALHQIRDTVAAPLQAEIASLFDPEWFLHDHEKGGGPEWQQVFIDYWNRPGAWAAMPEPLQEMTLAVGWKMFQEVRGTCLDPLPFEHYRIAAPMTLLYGSLSPGAPKEMVHQLQGVNPQARIEVMEGLGHMAPLTQPQRLVDAFQRHFGLVTGGV